MPDPYPAFIDKYQPKIRDAVLATWTELRKSVTYAELENTLITEGVNGMMKYLDNLEPTLRAMLMPDLQDAMSESGRLVVEILPSGTITVPGYVPSVQFTNPYAVQAVREYSFNMIREISTETRAAVRDSITTAVSQGRPPASVARDFKQTIGLTVEQEKSVQNYRKYLETLNRDALRRESRDKRFDRTVEAAIKNDKPLSKANIDKMVAAFRRKREAQRAQTIARTESMSALDLGQDMALNQTSEDGALAPDLTSDWHVARDGRQRDAHDVVPAMNPKGVPYGEFFQTPLGPMRYPRDRKYGTAANVINCRCRRSFKRNR